MRTTIHLFLYTILALVPDVASAQSHVDSIAQAMNEGRAFRAAEPIGSNYAPPIVPVVPAYPNRMLPQNPWGTGYSVVTKQRHRYDEDSDTTTSVTELVPNDALGRPMERPDSLWP